MSISTLMFYIWILIYINLDEASITVPDDSLTTVTVPMPFSLTVKDTIETTSLVYYPDASSSLSSSTSSFSSSSSPSSSTSLFSSSSAPSSSTSLTSSFSSSSAPPSSSSSSSSSSSVAAAATAVTTELSSLSSSPTSSSSSLTPAKTAATSNSSKTFIISTTELWSSDISSQSRTESSTNKTYRSKGDTIEVTIGIIIGGSFGGVVFVALTVVVLVCCIKRCRSTADKQEILSEVPVSFQVVTVLEEVPLILTCNQSTTD